MATLYTCTHTFKIVHVHASVHAKVGTCINMNYRLSHIRTAWDPTLFGYVRCSDISVKCSDNYVKCIENEHDLSLLSSNTKVACCSQGRETRPNREAIDGCRL